jgi:hypothetical protein
MALRLVEVIFQREDLQRFSHLTEEVPVVSIWTVGSNDTRSLVRILLDSKHTETLSDILMKEFGSRDEFRLISLPVEATLPIIEEEAKEKKEVQEPNPVKGESDRISREELYEDIAQGAKLTRVYVATVALSTIVAAVGLVRDDIAIVIGAMVIAPLLGPNVSLSLAATLGDLDLARRSLTTIALAAGAAGSLAFTTGVPAAVVGVMVSVALLPPLVVMGLMLGSGQSMLAFGSSMLLLTNITCINLAAVATFLVQRVRPRTWWEAERAKSATRIALAIWIVMFAILLGLILLGQIGAV